MTTRQNVVVSASFDDLRSPQVRFLEEAARLGNVSVLLWSDEMVRILTGKAPKFPEAERHYLVQAIKWVSKAHLISLKDADSLPATGAASQIWAVDESHDNPSRRSFCKANGVEYRVISNKSFAGYPKIDISIKAPHPGRKKVIVTGCYDWFHSGHVRFFEEVSALGDLYVSVGSDKNVELLKGAEHPMFKEDERRYLCESMRYVHQCLIGTGCGWLDAEPEIERIKADIYAVNEDGDKPQKREYCAAHGIEYAVLKRTPKEGLTRRSSTDLRGF